MPEFSQEGKPIRIETGAGGGQLLIRNFSGVEGISMPFEFWVEMVSINDSVDLKAALHQPAAIAIQLGDGSDRYIHGHIRKIVQHERGAEKLTTYRAQIVPWLSFLELFSDCRIFQNMNVQEILEKVFSDRGFKDFSFRLQSTPPKREYCVQYRETDFNFVSRLLEEEGIFYFFEHSESKHVLVLADRNSAIKPCPVQNEVACEQRGSLVEVEDVILGTSREEHVHTGKISLTDYDFEKPATFLRSSVSGEQQGEEHDYPGLFLTREAGDRLARIRLEQEEAQYLILRGDGKCRTLQSGYNFTLTDHYRKDNNQKYILTEVHHQAGDVDYISDGGNLFSYSNSFECIPFSVPYRPEARAEKPVIYGMQTAVVVGPSGEEIWVDEYGRVKVQFHWDREGQRNENSSCWIRTSETQAGKKWGRVSLPRIGQEVIVSFLEGDPDRPIIVGSVYNADQMPPYTLPDEKTKSTWKTYSSKGGGGFNEIRLEDKKGKEQIFIHAEKDQDIRIKQATRTFVGTDSSVTIERDQKEKVKGDQHLEVLGDKNEKVGGTVSLDAGMNLQEKVGMNAALDAGMEVHIKAGMTVVIEAGVSLTVKVGGNFININPAGVFIVGTMVMINSGGAAGSGSGSQPGAPTAPDGAATAEPGEATNVTVPPPVTPTTYSPAAQAMQSGSSSGAPFV